MALVNATTQVDWHPHVFHLPHWVEPVVIAIILFASTYITRMKDFSIFGKKTRHLHSSSSGGCENLLLGLDLEKASFVPFSPTKKQRMVFGKWSIWTPDSSRFAHHIHSRILQKFPFCVEMFYWVVQLLVYRLFTEMAAVYHAGSEKLWETAQSHGLAILELEATLLGNNGILTGQQGLEWRIQQWFLAGAAIGDWRGTLLSILDRSYSLIHIPSTACFIAFYYYTSPSFSRFAKVRRMVTLCNFIAFGIFLFYPCMPPRLLPAQYGFVDTVNGEDAVSIWMSGTFANRLAAMPSMHFEYAFCIGCVFIYESEPIQGLYELFNFLCESSHGRLILEYDRKHSTLRIVYFVLGFWYIWWVLLSIIATGNHYFLDAFVGMIVVLVSYIYNGILINFLPLEDVLLWILRLEKPIPTVGLRSKRLSERVKLR